MNVIIVLVQIFLIHINNLGIDIMTSRGIGLLPYNRHAGDHDDPWHRWSWNFVWRQLRDEKPALMFAAESGRTAIVEFLIQKGINDKSRMIKRSFNFKILSSNVKFTIILIFIKFCKEALHSSLRCQFYSYLS